MYIRGRVDVKTRAPDDINHDASLMSAAGFLVSAEVCELPHCFESVARRAICDNLHTPSLHVTRGARK